MGQPNRKNMITAIIILLSIDYALNLLLALFSPDRKSIDQLPATALILLLWSVCLPVAITMIVINSLIFLMGIATPAKTKTSSAPKSNWQTKLEEIQNKYK